MNLDLLCLQASTYRLAEVGWALACHSRKRLRFQSAGPLFRSLPPPVPATSTQTFACIRCKVHAHSHHIAVISKSPTQKMLARFCDFCAQPGLKNSNRGRDLPAGWGQSNRQACFSGRGSVGERACSWGWTWAPAQRWDVWSDAAKSSPTGGTA